MPSLKNQTAEVLDTFHCPSCKVKVTISRFHEGDMVCHPVPYCKMFDQMDGDEYADLLLHNRS